MRAHCIICVLAVFRGQRRSLCHHRPAGAAIIEFALVLPLLLLLVFGVVNFGALMYDQSVITNAAREGARWAAVRATATTGSGCTHSFSSAPADPCQVAYSYAHNRLISFNGVRSPQVSFVAESGFGTGAPQAVTVTYSYKGVGWFFGEKALSTYSQTSVMIHE
jgi:Flp pilus assembly protein TadG